MNTDILHALKQVQLQKAIGELRAFNALYYNPTGENSEYLDLNALIEDFINGLTDNYG